MISLSELSPQEVLIYLRKSRADDPALSVAEVLSRHERMLDDFSVNAWGDRVPESNRFREVCSGETIDARPEVQRVLRLIEQARFRAVLVVEPQRLSRGDLEDIGRLVKILRYTGTLVLTLQGAFDLTDARDRDFFERELQRGNDYLEYQKRILQNGTRASAERGNYLGAHAPYGYRRVFVREGRRKAPTLEIEPREADGARLIFELYAAGKGAGAICDALTAQGVPTKNGAPWRESTIYGILDNPVYAGLIAWGRSQKERVVVDGEIESRVRGVPARVLVPGKHPAIVTDALWGAVRARRAAANLPRAKSAAKPVNPFAGLVRCSCGGAVTMQGGGAPAGPVRLRCCARGCRTASCLYSDFVAAVTAALRQNLDDYTTVLDSGAPSDSASLDRLRRRVEALGAKEQALWEKYAEGMPRQIFDALLQKNTEERQAAAAALAEEEARLADRETLQVRAVSLHEVLDLLPVLDGVPVKAAGRVLRSCIREIRYHREPPVREKGGKNSAGWASAPIELSIELAF